MSPKRTRIILPPGSSRPRARESESARSQPASVPKGAADKRTGPELDRLAEITPENVDDARAAWRRDAPADLRNLLDAEERDDGQS